MRYHEIAKYNKTMRLEKTYNQMRATLDKEDGENFI